jgi:hypothetical protein
VSLAVRPRRVRPGRRMHVRLADRWRLGDLKPVVCTVPPGGPRECRRMGTGTRTSFRARRAGTWIVRARTPWQRVSRRVWARHPGGRLTLLATGDSMIQIIDGDLQRRLGARGPISVHSDAHISTGISKPSMFDWVAHARATAHGLHPDVTIMFLGANDGFPMGTPSGHRAPCCDQAWINEYARRARTMMRAYARGGAGTVYWLLLPTPRSTRFQTVFRPVNRALRSAATSFPGVVHVVDLGATFTPGGRFRQTMRWRGRTVTVRQADGVHLSVAGASIATTLVLRRMRRDGLLG